MQKFKDDIIENKMIDSTDTLFSGLTTEIDNMESQVFECYKLGELLYDNNRMPLVNAISRNIFTRCFQQIFIAWSKCGTFESYLDVFRKIFGETATIVFTVPGPGQLNVDISTDVQELFNFAARKVVGSLWQYDNVVDENGDNILFSTLFGIESQSELESVLYSMAPNGIYTQITLTLA